MKVSTRFKVKEVVGAVFGLELEIEGQGLPGYINDPRWQAKPDGSLRNGMEYVFTEPLGSVATKDALESLGQKLEEQGAKLDYSFRTSTHVHVNVSNLDLNVVKSLALLWYLFEDEYINFCDRKRKGNRFCLGLKDANDGVLANLDRLMSHDQVPPRDRGKYSALNLCTLEQFGTLEFRCLEGTNDWTRIFTWVRALAALRKASKELGEPSAVVEASREELANLLFPTERLKTQFLKEGWEQRFEYNRSLLFPVIARFVKD